MRSALWAQLEPIDHVLRGTHSWGTQPHSNFCNQVAGVTNNHVVDRLLDFYLPSAELPRARRAVGPGMAVNLGRTCLWGRAVSTVDAKLRKSSASNSASSTAWSAGSYCGCLRHPLESTQCGCRWSGLSHAQVELGDCFARKPA